MVAYNLPTQEANGMSTVYRDVCQVENSFDRDDEESRMKGQETSCGIKSLSLSLPLSLSPSLPLSLSLPLSPSLSLSLSTDSPSLSFLSLRSLWIPQTPHTHTAI